MSKLARVIALQEGFYVEGSLPQRTNNPGDLRHAPGERHPLGSPDSIGSFETVKDGWAALERQLELYAARGMTLQQAIYKFAPPTENDSAGYLNFVCSQLSCAPNEPIVNALLIN